MPAGDLRLGLSGRELKFDAVPPYCLVCGARPFANRTLPFKDPDYAMKKSQNLNSILEWMNPALAYFNWRRKVAFEIDAPLCFRHFWRGLVGEFLVIGVFLAALAAVIVFWWKGKLPTGPNDWGALMKGGLIAIFLVGGWLISRRGPGKPVLPCDVKRDGDVRVILRYPEGPPTPLAK